MTNPIYFKKFLLQKHICYLWLFKNIICMWAVINHNAYNLFSSMFVFSNLAYNYSNNIICSSYFPIISLNLMFSDSDFQTRTVKELVAIDKNTNLNSFEMSFVIISFILNSELYRLQSSGFSLSTSAIFKNLLWLEREIWEMFGVFFFYHPTLSRLLLDYNFIGEPLLKNFVFTDSLNFNISSNLTFVNYTKLIGMIFLYN